MGSARPSPLEKFVGVILGDRRLLHAAVLIVAAALVPLNLKPPPAATRSGPAPRTHVAAATLQPASQPPGNPLTAPTATAPQAGDYPGVPVAPPTQQLDIEHASATQLQQALAANKAEQARLNSELVARSALIEQLNAQVADLDSQIQTTGKRIELEQRQASILARAIYAQPSSAALALAESSNLGDFMTRTSDLAAANTRAHELTIALQADQHRLQAEQSRITAARDQQIQARQALEGWMASYQQTAAREQDVIAALARKAAEDAAAAQVVAQAQARIATGPSDIQDLIRQAFAPLGDGAVAWALRVAACESGYNPHAVNRYSGAMGLFQFMPSTWRSPQNPYHDQDPFDAKYNALAAAWLYGRSGPGQWDCR